MVPGITIKDYVNLLHQPVTSTCYVNLLQKQAHIYSRTLITETTVVRVLTYRLEVFAVGESLSQHLLKGGGLLNGKQ